MQAGFVQLAVIAALVAAPSAAAHARVVATQPAQGTVVPTAPAQVTIRFDEGVRLDGKLTLAGKPLPTSLRSHGTLLVATLPQLADGDYVAVWRVVSDDGHLETGAVAFGVGVGTPPPATVVDQTTQRDWALAIGRWIFLAGLLAGAGIAAVRLLTGRREQDLADAGIAAALAVAIVGALLELSRIPGAVHTRFGLVTWIAAGVAAAAALAAVARLTLATEALTLALLLAPPLSGHALASDRPTWLALPSDLVHTASAAVWIGGVAWLALLAARRKPGLRAAAARFSRVALVAVAVLGASGVARAGAELRSLHEVWDTSYGQLLVAKSVLLAALLAVAAVWTRRAASTERLRLSLSVETVLLAALLAAVAGLSTVTPPRNAPRPLSSFALPAPAVVFGREAGALAVGIEAAAAGGQLGARVTVLDETGANANGVDVSVQGEPAESCGDGLYCFRGPAARIVRLRVAGHPLSVTLPAAPEHAKARRAVRAAAAATRALRSVVIRERLSASPKLVLETVFRIVHPDRTTYHSVVHEHGATRFSSDAVVIGGTRWDRTMPSGPWQRSSLQPLDQPVPDWRTALDPSLLGETARTWLVSFRDPTVPAWFEVTIDKRTGRPLRVDMTAAAHFMVRQWGSFDDPLTIRPPR